MITVTPELMALTAGEWRARGLEVPADVPDCAVIECDGLAPGEIVKVGTRIVFGLHVVRPRWHWVTLTGTISFPAEPDPSTKGPTS